MTKRLLLSMFLGGVFSMGLLAQPTPTILSDLTSKLTNADFSADQPVTTLITTYDYNMADAGLGAGGEALFGQQPVTGWTASSLSDNIKVMQSSSDADRGDGTNAKAAGIFALLEQDAESGPGLGSAEYMAPYNNAEAQDLGITGPVLGMVAVWGADYKYTQEVTLPAGDYMIVTTYFNVGVGSAIAANNMGFTTSDGKAYLSSRKDFPVNVWEKDTVIFRLEADATGEVSLGLKGDGGSGAAAHIFFDNIKIYSISPAYLDQVVVDEAKAQLLALIEEAEATGVDATASKAVYDNPNATLEQVKEAIENQKALNAAGITDLSEFFIRNPHFAEGEAVEGGICTYDYDCEKNNIATTNYSMLDVPGWTQNKKDNGAAAGVYAVGSNAFLGGTAFLPPTTLSDGETTEANLLGIVTCWGMTAQYKQTVTLQPGKYTLGISYYNAGGAQAVAKNLIGFVADNGTEYLGETTTFPVGKWTNEKITFELEEETDGYFTLGYVSANTGSGNMPHFFVDGFSLYYVGTGIDPALFALQAAVAGGNRLLDNRFNADLYDRLQQAVEAGEDYIINKNGDSETYKAATEAITSLTDEVNASIAAYEALNNFYENDLLDASEKYKEYEELSEAISTLLDEVPDAYENGSWTDEKIYETIASLPVMIRTEVKKLWDVAVASGEKLEKDLDITPLFDQLSYTYSTTVYQGSSVPDKEWNFGNASNFKTQYGTAEVWNQSPFTVSRTLANMPAGKYTITTKAFFRNSDNETNFSIYDEANTPEASVFAGSVKTGLANVVSVASYQQFDGWAAAGDMFVPNSQKTAYDVFNDDAYTETLQKSVSTAIIEDGGELTFGITAEQMESNSWVVWYGFSIAYNAVDDDALDAEILALVEKATVLLENNEIFVEKAVGDLGTACDQGNEAVDGGSTDDKLDAIKALQASYEYAMEAISIQEKLTSLQEFYGELLAKYDYVSEDNTISEVLNSLEEGFETNEQAQNVIDQMPVAWVAYVMGQDMSEASVENPVDVTGVIINADFESGNVNYWTLSEGIGQNQGFQNNNEYRNDDKNILVSQFIEAWRPSGTALGDGTIAQTLLAPLPEGYYVLAIDGYATNQTEIPEGGIQGAYLVANVGDASVTTPIGIETAGGVPEHFEVAFHSDGVSPVTVGLSVYQTNASWIVADNFTLSFVGDTYVAVEGVDADVEKQPLAIYNLAGQRVQKAVKGLYIINGKKYIVR
ncbi:MAG: hypothetical protein IJV08_00035 [Bacteroidaceae bacterium]|nr:hypothetical protein [Bacteroidaceae bacterium]